jgi:hypothetical protein
VIDPVFDQGPPKVLKEGPEARGGSLKRDSVSQDPIKVGMSVHKARRQDFSYPIPDFFLRIFYSQLVVRCEVRDFVIEYTNPPCFPRGFQTACNQPIWEQKHAAHAQLLAVWANIDLCQLSITQEKYSAAYRIPFY